MYISKKATIATLIIALLAIFGVALLTSNKGPAAADAEVLHAAYPLYAGIGWKDEVPLSVPPHLATNPTDQTIIGNVVTSLPTATTTNIAAIAEPFRTYYDDLLIKRGWRIAPNLQADGPGSSVWGYTKGFDVLILSYNTTFWGTQPNEPVQCPCTVEFGILGGTFQK